MKYIKHTIIIFSISILYSCGGVTGNIEKYRFSNTTIALLKIAVKKVNIVHPEFKNFDTTKYQEGINGLDDGDFYCRIKENEQNYLFQYAYPQYPLPNDTIVEIALTSAAEYGKDLNLAKNINFFEKAKYRKLFEKYFIAEVKKKMKE